MATLEIEIDPNEVSQQWRQDLDGETYLLKAIYNEREGQYQLEISDSDGRPLATAPLVLGHSVFSECSVVDLPPGQWVVVDALGEGGPANQETVGRNVKLFYVEASA